MNALFLTQAQANRWANQLLFQELHKLSPAQWAFERGVNFGGIMGIANHLLLADRAWLHRFTGEGESPSTVDAVPCPALADLWPLRQAEDERIVAFAAGLDPAQLAGTLRYASMSGAPCAEPFAVCLAHFFNHQTFHRGQLHALLGVEGVACPNLDLIYYQAAQRTGRA